MTINDHIAKYLKFFFSAKHTKFAVLITGRWGSGKTYFAKNIICNASCMPESLKSKAMYISLFGVNSLNELKFKVVSEAYIGENVDGLTSLMGKGFRTLAEKFVGNLGDLSGTVVAEIVAHLKEQVIIIDDLERCSIPIPELFGFINSLIEHQNFKIVIVANESEIKDTDAYNNSKEKLIGPTFCFNAPITLALSHFVNATENSKLKHFLSTQTDIIKLIFDQSETNNLRILERTLFAFEQLWEHLSLKAQEQHDFLVKLLHDFLMISFEIRSGKYSEGSEILCIDMVLEQAFAETKNAPNESSENSFPLEKYDFNITEGLVFPMDFLWDFINNNAMSKSNVEQALKQSSFFYEATTPKWLKLVNFLSLSSKGFDNLLHETLKDWDHGSLPQDYRCIFHLFGLFLHFSKAGIIDSNPKELLSRAKLLLNDMVSHGTLDNTLRLPNSLMHEEGHMNRSASFGHQHWSLEDEEFAELSNYFNGLLKHREAEEILPKRAKELLEYLPDNILAFFVLLDPNFRDKIESGESSLCSKPVFARLSPEKFFNKLLTVPNANKRQVFYAFDKRYLYYKDELLPEKDFLTNLAVKIDNYLKGHNDAASYPERFLLQEFRNNYVFRALNRLEPKAIESSSSP